MASTHNLRYAPVEGGTHHQLYLPRPPAGMKVQDIKRLKDLEKENVRLKKVVAELTLDKEILKEALEGK